MCKLIVQLFKQLTRVVRPYIPNIEVEGRLAQAVRVAYTGIAGKSGLRGRVRRRGRERRLRPAIEIGRGLLVASLQQGSRIIPF